MAAPHYPVPVTEHYVEANGLKIWYVEAGQGTPLLLLHGGTVSNGPIWADSPYGWGGHLGRFAEHFHVIAPDTRGHGRTLNHAGALSYSVFAEDLIALIQALHLERPLFCGFSDGGITASLVGIIAPDLPRAIVNLAGYDVFNPDPDSPARVMGRTWLGGGDPHATKTNLAWPDSPSPMGQKRIDDYEPAQGPGYVKRYFEQLFDLWIGPLAYTVDDLAKITAPTMILVGDRDGGCSVEEGVAAYRKLPHGEMGMIPGIEHAITPLVCTVALDFLLRHRSHANESSVAGASTPAAEPVASHASAAPGKRRRWSRRR